MASWRVMVRRGRSHRAQVRCTASTTIIGYQDPIEARWSDDTVEAKMNKTGLRFAPAFKMNEENEFRTVVMQME
jgi:hypothetical protein